MIRGKYRHTHRPDLIVIAHGTRQQKRDGYPEYTQVCYSHDRPTAVKEHMRDFLFLDLFEPVEQK